MEFKNKTILIISPNFWGKMMVSKHHYALELAKMGNTVYFLNPPNLQKSYFEKIKVVENLWLIDYKPIFRGKRYLPICLYNLLVYLQAKYLQKKIGPIDIVWSFCGSIFNNLNYFKTKCRIFHPVDQIETEAELSTAKFADIIFSVSDVILKNLELYRTKTFFMNHGLSHFYENTAKLKLSIIANSASHLAKINVGYVGNLLLKSLDRRAFVSIILENQDINFTLYGSYKIADSNLSGFINKESSDFIDFMEKQPNVILKGPQSPEIIEKEIDGFDAFIVLINPENDYNKGSNSHKIIEYLSKGKVVISNHVSTYSGKDQLIEMVEEMHNEHLPALFKKVINNLEYYNSPELQRKRIEYALDNTYEKQIKRIEAKINESFR